MTHKNTALTVGLVGLCLLVAGCGTTSSRLDRALGDMGWRLPHRSSPYDKRKLAEAVERDPFPKAGQSMARTDDTRVATRK